MHVNPTKVYAITGESINLTCHHPFNSNATVLWNKGPFYQENRISGVTEPTILIAGSVLQIHHFNASRHAGQYTCSVEGPKKENIISCPSELVLACELINTSSFIVVPQLCWPISWTMSTCNHEC